MQFRLHGHLEIRCGARIARDVSAFAYTILHLRGLDLLEYAFDLYGASREIICEGLVIGRARIGERSAPGMHRRRVVRGRAPIRRSVIKPMLGSGVYDCIDVAAS